MATISTSISSSFINTSNSILNSHSSSQSFASSIKYKKAPISASYATTADRTSTSASAETESIRSFRNTCSSSLYEVLGVRIGADTREVKSAYRRLARVLHPDVASSDSSSADEFMRIHAAYSTLSDPEKRADYDRSLFQRPARVSSPVRSAGGYTSRRWETDQCW
ncbi:chaperone protein dnaJ 11, chloroplastic-like [Rutidosis leptorrhynchoides]|uniref:chaperone protein dnaJ 11, chloroplastic-like n=1 Tax=Rutidosis leptorrhynchoides TaxID=125765 RepID=UPI003A991141